MLFLASAAAHSPGVALLLAELVIIAIVAVAVKYVRLPYTIALVAAGLGVGILRAQHYLELDIQLTPELVFSIFLPALLFEAAFNLHFHQLRENTKPILLLAIIGVVMAAVGVAYCMHLSLGMPLGAALVFGALISATDPISVLALFKELKAPGRLSILVEGESLLNDGAAVVVFKILLALALTGQFSLGAGLVQFLVVSVGGILLGVAFGYFIAHINAFVDDHLIEITLSTILAYGSYLVAEHLGASGVMAVIAAGLVYGNYGVRIGMSPNTRMMMAAFWEYAGFLMNSLVFLLIGTQVDLRLLAGDWQRILVAFGAVIAVRAVVVLILGPVGGIIDKPIPWRWQVVMVWAGLRGSISMALAMGLPKGLPWREDIILITFGVVILSLFAQGLTMPRLLRGLGIIGHSRPVIEFEERLGQVLMHQRACHELQRLRHDYYITEPLYERLKNYHQTRLDQASQELRKMGDGDQAIRDEQVKDAKRNILAAQVTTLHEAHGRGLIGDEALETLMNELAAEQQRDLQAEHDQRFGQPPDESSAAEAESSKEKNEPKEESEEDTETKDE